MKLRRIALALAALWIVAAAPLVSLAQTPAEPAPPAPEEPEGPTPYPQGEVSIQAEKTRAELTAMSDVLAPIQALQDIDDAIPAAQKEFAEATADTTRVLAADPISFKALEDAQRQWTGRQNQVRAWRDQLTARAGEVDQQIARLGVLGERWKLTRAAATETDSATAMEWIDSSLARVAEAEKAARARAKALVDLQKRLGVLEAATVSNLTTITKESQQQRSRLLEPDSPPIWQGWRPDGDAAGVLERVRSDWERDIASLRKFAEQSSTEILEFLLLLIVVLVGTVVLANRVDSWTDEDDELRQTARVFHRPVSVALLASLMLSPYFFPLAPGILFDILGGLLLIPAVRLLAPLVASSVRPIVYALAVFYFSSQIRVMLEAAPVASRLLFTFELVVAIGALLWLLRPARLARIEPEERPPALLGRVMRAFLVLMVLAFASNLLGYFGFAKVVGRGVLTTIYAALVVYGVFRIFMIFVAVLMRTPAARRLRMVRRGGETMQRWIGRFVVIGLALFWCDVVIEAFTVRNATLGLLGRIVGTELTVGALEISLGDVLLFVGVVAGSFYTARFVRFVLEEDVFPRVVLRRGVPNAISTTVTYALLLFGFVLALGAAGVDLSRISLLAGAFGVGIGFGLQDVVNNFVSGLILLFERPIQVGDTIQMQDETLLGEVRRIGPRSSTVRTFDGAEVIVPNGMLISSQVINWTLSDRRRRLIVDIGVKYGTDPEQVLEILRQVAAENETVLEDPEPGAIFLGFGDSSLDFQLRCWIPRFEEGFGMRTALRVAIYAKLNAAGIEIPFPQRDLHLRSVDDAAARTLRGD